MTPIYFGVTMSKVKVTARGCLSNNFYVCFALFNIEGYENHNFDIYVFVFKFKEC